MHPAVYAALIDARENQLRIDRHRDRPARKPRVRFAVRVAIRTRRLRAA